MANPTKDQLVINALRERVELLQNNSEELGQIIETKNFIIKDQKGVILDYKSKLMKSNTNLTETVKRYNKEIVNNNEKQFKLINDLNICQYANKRQTETIEALKLENEELNYRLKISDKIFYYISIPYLIVSAIYFIITLIK
jgi:hypothetical protein